MPMKPIVIRFEGASLPNTEDGTIVGAAITADAAAAVLTKVRRVGLGLWLMMRFSMKEVLAQYTGEGKDAGINSSRAIESVT